MKRTKLPLSEITVSNRLRKDYGEDDMERLCDSMERYGLIQPIVVNEAKQLIAGGRRYAAATSLGWTEIDVVFKETLSQDYLHELELEENIQRLDMSWQEEVQSVAEIHRLKASRNAVEGLSWGMRETGRMLNMSVGKIVYTLEIADHLARGDAELASCSGVTDALKLLWKRKEDEAARELAARSLIPTPLDDDEPGQVFPRDPDAPEGFVYKQLPPAPPKEINTVSLSKTVLLQPDLSFSVLRSLPDGCCDHCLTDPPYGIDLDNINQIEDRFGDVENLKVSHDVDENKAMFPELFREVFRVTRDKAFFALWCDIMNWQLLYDSAIAAGWRVQRWPFVWCKSHQCLNQMAQYNATKDVEFAMICRKPNAILRQSSQTSFFSASNQKARERYDHPFAKPEECACKLYELFASPGQTVLEPFAGRGSLVVPMIEAGRNVIAIEYDKTHFAYLVENVKKAHLFRDPETKFI